MSSVFKQYTRRFFLKSSLSAAILAFIPTGVKSFYREVKTKYFTKKVTLPVNVIINGNDYEVNADTRTTLLDLLRENLQLTGTKKGCDHGQCGACTVHIDGERALSCLTLSATLPGKKVTTIEGLANGDQLHPMQEAFLEFDGYQCGYCTPGQIMSGIACVNEGHANSIEEIKTYMSGNICRCGAYNGISQAILNVAKS